MIFLVVPSLIPTGPIKGAIAFANQAIFTNDVTLITLKGGSGADAEIDNRIKVINLESFQGYKDKATELRKILRHYASHSTKPRVISYCFSADLVTYFCRKDAVICSSIRSNLFSNYRMDYGFGGIFLALLHFWILRRFDYVTAMTQSMARQINKYSARKAIVIGNFIDEAPLIPKLSHQRAEHPVFVFLGSLTKRKKVDVLLSAFKSILNKHPQASLHLLGDGKEREELEKYVKKLDIENNVIFYGYQADPHIILATADIMVLPSLSEGMSRAVLESLFLGVPVVMRDVDGNSELITNGVNGELFEKDEQLAEKMNEMLLISRQTSSRISLLPEAYRQENATRQYLTLLSES